ncbi:MAG: hypothetical protein AAFV77_03170, partial [Planctomycetota bacterium]
QDAAETVARSGQLMGGPALGARDTVGRYTHAHSYTYSGDGDADGADGYGGDRTRTTADVAMHILMSTATRAQRVELMKWAAINGLSAYHASKERGAPILTPGGHDQGLELFMAWGLDWAGEDDRLATLGADVGYQGFHQPYIHDQATIDGLQPHDTPISSSYDGNKWWMSRRLTVASVSGQDVTVDLTQTQGDIVFSSTWMNATITNENTGQTWPLVSHGRYSRTLTLQAGHDVLPTHVITGRPAYAIAVGDPDWRETGDQPARSFGDNAQYRGLFQQSTTALGLRATGTIFKIDAGPALWAYVARANQANEPAGFDFPGCDEHSAATAFRTAHQGTIEAMSSGSASGDARVPGSRKPVRAPRYRTGERLRA